MQVKLELTKKQVNTSRGELSCPKLRSAFAAIKLWAVIEFIPIEFINPTKSGGVLKIGSFFIQKVII